MTLFAMTTNVPVVVEMEAENETEVKKAFRQALNSVAVREAIYNELVITGFPVSNLAVEDEGDVEVLSINGEML